MMGMTTPHLACVLRAAKLYRIRLLGEIQQLEEQMKRDVPGAARDWQIKVAECECLDEAISILWYNRYIKL
jgi:hypothetical protein